MEKSKSSNNRPAAPDGGYGWVIVLATFLQISVIVQILPLFGVIFGAKFEEFESSHTEKSGIVSVFLVCTQIPILLVGPLGEMSSHRIVALIASGLQSTGLLIAAFSSSISHLIVGVGLFCGFGIGFSATNNIIVINKYFTKKVGAAMGITTAMIDIVGLTLPQLLKVLIPICSSQTVILVYMGICLLTTLIGALLFKPLPRYNSVTQDDDIELKKNSKDRTNVIKKMLGLIEWSLLKKPYFVFIITVNALVMTIMFINISETTLIARSRQFSLAEQADLVTIISTTGIFLKIGAGMLMDSALLKRVFKHPMKMLYIFSSLCMSLCMTGMALTDSFIELSIIVVVLSFFNANIMLNFSQILR